MDFSRSDKVGAKVDGMFVSSSAGPRLRSQEGARGLGFCAACEGIGVFAFSARSGPIPLLRFLSSHRSGRNDLSEKCENPLRWICRLGQCLRPSRRRGG